MKSRFNSIVTKLWCCDLRLSDILVADYISALCGMGYRQSASILVLFFSAISSGCGGGGGSTGGGTNPPPTPTYTVSGTVSGLAGTLFLQNNGTDLLGLNTDGSFSFGKPVSSGKAYD